VALFGTTLESELESVTGRNTKDVNRKRQRMMEKWLDLPQRFRSPLAATRNRKPDEDSAEVTVQGDML
jgi:hypothetical protein